MPGGDQTGPRGLGPMTGRAAGYCAGYAMPGAANPGVGCRRWGRGMGGGGPRGGGRRRRGANGAPWVGVLPPASIPAPRSELALLKDQAEYLTQALAEVRQRMAGCETEGAAT